MPQHLHHYSFCYQNNARGSINRTAGRFTMVNNAIVISIKMGSTFFGRFFIVVVFELFGVCVHLKKNTIFATIVANGRPNGVTAQCFIKKKNLSDELNAANRPLLQLSSTLPMPPINYTNAEAPTYFLR